MPAGYPDFSWFVRAVKILPIVAAAALAGGVIGGFSVIAVDKALTWSPRQRTSPRRPFRRRRYGRLTERRRRRIRQPGRRVLRRRRCRRPLRHRQQVPHRSRPCRRPLPKHRSLRRPLGRMRCSRSHAAPAVSATTPQPVPAATGSASAPASPAPIAARAAYDDAHADAVPGAPQPQTNAPPTKTASGPVARPEAAKRREMTSLRLSQSADGYARGPNARRVYDYYGTAKYNSRTKTRDPGDARDRDDNDADNAPDQSTGAPQVQLHQSSTRDDSDVITTRTRVTSRRRQQGDPNAQSSDERPDAAPRPEPFWGFFGNRNEPDDDDQ